MRRKAKARRKMDETATASTGWFHLLKKNPDGLRLRELSTELGASMARVRTDLEILTHELPVTSWFDDNGEECWSLISTAVAAPVPAFTPAEVLALLWALDRQDSPELNRVRAKLFQALLGKGSRRRWIPVKNRLLIKGWRELYDSPETERLVARDRRGGSGRTPPPPDYIDAAGEAFPL